MYDDGCRNTFCHFLEIVNAFLLGELLQFEKEICDDDVRCAASLCSAERYMEQQDNSHRKAIV